MKLEAGREVKIVLICAMFLAITACLGWRAARFDLYGQTTRANVLERSEVTVRQGDVFRPAISVRYEYEDQGVSRVGSFTVPTTYEFDASGTELVRHIPGSDESYIGTRSSPWVWYALPLIGVVLLGWRVRVLLRVLGHERGHATRQHCAPESD